MGKGARKTGAGKKAYDASSVGPAPKERMPADFRALNKGRETNLLTAHPRAGCDIDAIGRNKKKDGK